MTGNNLKTTLHTMKLTQGALAERLQVDRNTVSRWATGATPVPGYVGEYLRVLALAHAILNP
jgi:transcriptional regulator with XRE-family HTH domain